MIDTTNLHNAIKGMYDEQLLNEEVFVAGNNLISFFYMLVYIYNRNKSKNKRTENEQNYECLHKQCDKGSEK